MPIWICIILITVAATCWNLAVVFQKQAADTLPLIAWGKDLPRVLLAFLRSVKWMGGLIISAAGYGFFMFALFYTPISLARAIQGSGLVVLAFFSIFFLNHRLKAWEWMAVIVVTLGILALGLSEPPESKTPSVLVPASLALAAGIVLLVCFIVYGAKKALGLGANWAVTFAIVSGTITGMADVFTKTITIAIDHKTYGIAFGMIGPVLVLFYLTGFFLLSRAYQHGRALMIIAVNDFCARLVALFVGMFAMGEALPADPLLMKLRVAGFIVVLSGTVLLSRFSGEQLADELKRS